MATFTITPALAAALLKEDSREKDTPLVRVLRWGHKRLYAAAMRARGLCLVLAAALFAASIFLMSLLGAEFLPTLGRATSGSAPPCPARFRWRRAMPRSTASAAC